VTETAYVLAAGPPHRRAALDRYADLPCDYTDATLIELAERVGIAAIATIDQRDFSVYRLRGRKRFRILLP